MAVGSWFDEGSPDPDGVFHQSSIQWPRVGHVRRVLQLGLFQECLVVLSER